MTNPHPLTEVEALAMPYLVGHITRTDPYYIADEDGRPLWEAEVQCSGGYSEIARTWAGSENEARQQAEAIASALASLHSGTSAQPSTEAVKLADELMTRFGHFGPTSDLIVPGETMVRIIHALNTTKDQSNG